MRLNLLHLSGAFGEQFGPTRASRAMAIVHIAMFDSINAIMGGYQSYTGIAPAPSTPTAQNKPQLCAAIAQSAHDTLVALFPSQKPTSTMISPTT